MTDLYLFIVFILIVLYWEKIKQIYIYIKHKKKIKQTKIKTTERTNDNYPKLDKYVNSSKLLVMLYNRYPSFDFSYDVAEFGLKNELVVKKNNKLCFIVVINGRPNNSVILEQVICRVTEEMVEWEGKNK